MSNHTQRNDPATIDQKMDLLVTYFAKGYVKSGKIDDQAVAVALAREVIDQYTQRLVLEGKLAQTRRIRHHIQDVHGTTGHDAAYFVAEQELLQFKLDKLNGDRES